MREAKGDGSHLLRVLGVAFGVAAVIGGTIGQGILRAPGLVASGVPDATWMILLWVAGGVFAMIDAMSTVELAASLRRTGGAYVFVTRAFGRLAGIAAGLSVWLGYVGIVAAVAVLFAGYVQRLGIATTVPISVLAVAILAFVAGVQALGTRISGWSQEAISAVKALIFIVLIVALLLAPRGAPVAAPVIAGPVTLIGVIIAMRAIVGTYLGWEAAAYFGEEMKDPARAIVRATFGGIALVTTIYVLANMAFLSVLTPHEMAGADLVAADAAHRALGPMADTIVTAASLVSLISIMNIAFMIFPRQMFAMARDAGIARLSHVARNGSPQVALALMFVVAVLLSLIGVYEILLAFTVWLMTAVAASVNLAAIVLRRREPGLDRPYRMPFFPAPAIFSLIVNLLLLAGFLYENAITAVEATVLLAVLAGVAFVATKRSATVD